MQINETGVKTPDFSEHVSVAGFAFRFSHLTRSGAGKLNPETLKKIYDFCCEGERNRNDFIGSSGHRIYKRIATVVVLLSCQLLLEKFEFPIPKVKGLVRVSYSRLTRN